MPTRQDLSAPPGPNGAVFRSLLGEPDNELESAETLDPADTMAPPSWTFRPLGERVIVTPLAEGDRTTASGIVIPDTAKERPSMGTVIALGPAARVHGLAPGERVLYGKYSGHEVTIDDVLYIVLSVGELLSVLEPTSSHDEADAAITERMERHGEQLEAESRQEFPDE